LSFLGSCTLSNLNKSEEKIPTSNITTEINNPTPIPTITPIPTPTNTPIAITENKIIKPTSTSTPTVTNTPEPPSSYTNEMAKLIFEKNIDSKQITLTSVTKTLWKDKSMNCPKPGIYYEKFTPPDHGFIYILESDKEKWEYHSDSTGELTINCTEVKNNMTDSINISKNNLFEKAISIKIYRNNQQKIPVLAGEITDKNEILYISELLNIQIPLIKKSNCEAKFKIVFNFDKKDKNYDWFCENNKNMIKGYGDIWIEFESVAPKEFQNVIGKYLSGKPLPIVPGMD
tara:strand:- start:38718 stop:39578 length:861 start_codon:yes stop_codon:yes gene_type:complete